MSVVWVCGERRRERAGPTEFMGGRVEDGLPTGTYWAPCRNREVFLNFQRKRYKCAHKQILWYETQGGEQISEETEIEISGFVLRALKNGY